MGIAIANDQDVVVDTAALARLAKLVLADEGIPEDAELVVHLVGEAAIAELNEHHLGHEGPTDVLSFPIEDPDFDSLSTDGVRGGPPLLLGDVLICPRVAERQAIDHEATVEDELALLVTHGILHILGYDHEDDDEAELMEARERELLERHHNRSGRQ